MARNIFGPMGVMTTPDQAGPATAQPPSNPQAPAKKDVSKLAQQYRIPPNILMALEERGEDPEAKAAEIAQALKSGKTIEDVVPYASLVRASDIADEIEGIQPKGGIGKAIGAGIDTVQQAYGSAIEGAGKSLGIDGMQSYGARVAEDNAAEAQSESRGLTGLWDIDGVGSGSAYLGETIAQQIPQLATNIGPVAAGAAIGSFVPGVGTAVGAGVGAAAAFAQNIAQMYGFNRERQKEANDGEVNELAAFGTAIPQAGLDLAADALIATPLGLGPKALSAGNMATRIMKGAGLGVAAEAPTEAAQAAMERAQAGLPVLNAEAGKEYLENAIAGGLVGGVFGGARGAVSRDSRVAEPDPQDPNGEEAQKPLLALPSPTNGGTIFGQAPARTGGPITDPNGDGSAVGQDSGAAPNQPGEAAPLSDETASGPSLSSMATPKAPRAVKDDPEADLEALTLQEAEKRLKAANERIGLMPKPSKKVLETRDKLQSIVEQKRNDPNATPQEVVGPQADSMGSAGPVGSIAGSDRVGEVAVPEGDEQASGTPAAPLAGGREGLAGTDGGPNDQPALTPTAVDDSAAADIVANEAPRAPVAPITTAPADRLQPDMLGGDPVTEEDMAAKERTRREWGRILGIASGQSQGDGKIGGRIIRVRGTSVRVLASEKHGDRDRTIDTDGMNRDQIAAEIRGALNQLDRSDPLPVTPPKAKPIVRPDAKDAWEKMSIAARKDTLRGVYERTDLSPEQIETSLSKFAEFSWQEIERDSKKDGFQAFADAVAGVKKPAPVAGGEVKPNLPTPKAEPTPPLAETSTPAQPVIENVREKAAVIRGIPESDPPVVDGVSFQWDKKDGGFVFSRKHVDKVREAIKAPSAQDVQAAAAQTNPNPTPAQAEAENYRTGKLDWRGQKLSIENAKGSTRSKIGPDGKTAWSVKMPAHYGRILGTKGADGDHVDFYMGDDPRSESVFVVDQIDPKTGKFDEHKIMLGFRNEDEAKATYYLGFSDKSGPSRMGAITTWSAGDFDAEINNPERWLSPVGRIPKQTSAPAASELTWGDFDESSTNDPNMPSGYELTSIRRLTKDEAKAEGYEWPAMKAVVKRDRPAGSYKVESAISENSRANAIAAALERAKKGAVATTEAPAPKPAAEPDLGTQKGLSVLWERMGDPDSGEGQTAIKTLKKGEMVIVGDIGITMNKEGKEYVLRFYNRTKADGQPNHQRVVGDKKQGDVIEAAYRLFRGLANERLRDSALKFTMRPADRKGMDVTGYDYDQSAIEDHLNDGGVVTVGTQMVYVEAHVPSRGYMNMAVSHRRPNGITMQKTAIDFARDGSVVAMPRADDYHETVKEALREAKIAKPQAMKNAYELATDRAGVAWDAMPEALRKTWLIGNGRDADKAARWAKDAWADTPIGIRSPFMADFEGGKIQPPAAPMSDFSAIFDELVDETFGAEEPAADPAPVPTVPKPSPEPQGTPAPRTAGEAAASAAENLMGSMEDIAKGLDALFGGGDKTRLNSGPTFDAETYAKAKPFFVAALRKMGQATTDIREMVGAMIRDLMGAGLSRDAVVAMKPYVGKFIEDIESGAIDPWADQTGKSPVSQNPQERGNVGDQTTSEVVSSEQGKQDSLGEVGQGGKPQAGGIGNVQAGQPDGNGTDRPVAGAKAGSSESNAGVRGGQATGSRSGGEVGRTDDGNDPARLPAIGRPDAGSSGLVDAGSGRDRPVGRGRPNYRITNPEALFAGGPKARFRKNREALETYQRVSDEGREPTTEELDAMAAYIGWGSFGQELFQGTFEYRGAIKSEWKDEDAWLRDTLGKEAWLSAQNSIINAHYTDPPTVKAIWSAIEAMGFKGGRVLEPSMGIGNFFGLMPQHLERASQLTGIELDKTTGGMAKMLYPRANVRVMGYEKSMTPDSFYDLVIGNWPFANFSPADRRYEKLNASLHDYFFVKAVDQVRPGGLVVGITSAFSMDGTKNRNVRLHLAKRAELVASFRLPSGAFEKYAGTKVVTDLVIYRKRDAMIMDTSQEAWVKSAPFTTPSGEDINVNQYYIDNPDQILGTLDYGSGTTYFQSGMIVRRPDNIGELLEGISKRVPADGYKPIEKRGKEPRFVANNTTDRRFSVTVGSDGALYQVLGDQMAALEDIIKYRTKNEAESKAREDQFRKLVDLRRKVGAVMDADRDGAEDADAKRAELKKAYQAFRKAHGAIGDSYAIGMMRSKLKDPFTGLLMALENKDGTPAAIMEKATVRAARKLDNPSIRDAFVISRNESVALNLDRIAEMAKTTVAAAAEELVNAKAIYRVPGGGYEPSDVYLSGNVRQKLAEAREAATLGEDMADSIAALEAVQPPDIPYFQIEARFGADWLDPEVNRQFLIEALGIEYKDPDDVKLIRGVTGWRVELSDRVARMRGVSDITGAPTTGRKSTGLSLSRFLQATLNTQTISVTQEDGDGGTMKDTKATEQANAKAAELREKFSEWVWKDPERRFEVERVYNDTMNAIATPQIDGSFMEFPGMALTRGTSLFNLRKHQSDAIWKGILNQRGIYGHEVGTGKTITMAGIAVESRRYGLAKKPLLIAHNANSSAVATEAQETYPGAKIMYVDNLSPKEIEAQLGRMATEDWDMIVIPHSLIDRMALSEKTLMQMAADDIAAYEAEAIAAAKDEGIELTTADMDGDAKELTKKLFSSPTAKEMAKARNRLIESIRKQAMRASKEGAVIFEDLGIDMILVDESHEFKKPPIATRMQVKGLNKQTSDKSLTLRFLTSYVKAQRGGTGVHVFTGTPLTNTLTEIYHQMYYIMDDVMRVNKVDTWDGFFKTFANTISDVEVTSTNEYENVERLAAFINVSELRRMAGQYMDIVFADDMPEFKPRTTLSGKDMNSKDLTDKERAELLDGRNDDPQGRPYKKVVHDIGPMGADQSRILQQVVQYANAFKTAGGKERREIQQRGGPDSPIVYNNVPNRASMDARLQEIDAEDDPNSKANRAVKNISRIYNDEPKATQVLFLDEGYSDQSVSVKTNKETGEKTKTKKAKFNLVADIVEKLVKEGVKRDEIVIVAGGVTADEKRAIADKMNALEVRVVIGQTKTLGVGVNMQKYLRAMHHLDAPWMPGDLEQRNGRGQRQGNTWNTVYEYRYLTESLDGRRWQVLAIKDRFIKAFLKAKEGLRTIEGDAADDGESMDSASLGDTLAEAAGDPRLMQSQKLTKRIEKLQSRERIHSQGIADAISKAKRLRATAEREEAALPPRRADAEHVNSLREESKFSATVNGKTYDKRPDAEAAIEAYLPSAGLKIRRGMTETLDVEVNGFKVEGQVMQYASMGNVDFRIVREGTYTIGKPSLSSIEGAIRRIPARLADAEATLVDTRNQAARLDEMAKESFQQQKDLDQKKLELERLKQDMQDNPVPAPVWLRQGAPIDTEIFVDGEGRVVTGHRWTETGWFLATDQGDVDYASAKDQFGMAIYDVIPFVAPKVEEGSKAKMGDEDRPAPEMRGDVEPVATLTGNELGLYADVLQLGKKAEKWYRESLSGKSAINADKGWTITFTNAGARKVGGRKGENLYRMVPALRQIIERGVVTLTELDANGNETVKAWHTISARVQMDGRIFDVVAKVKETPQGHFHYDLSGDSVAGARFGTSISPETRAYGLEDNPGNLNLEFAGPEGKREPMFDEPASREVVKALNAELQKTMPGKKVSVRYVRKIYSQADGAAIMGRANRDGSIEVSETATGGASGAIGVLRHEIIHQLRNAALWGSPNGLFEAREWGRLVAAAEAEPGIVQSVQSRYKGKGLTRDQMQEEYVAELYRLWAAQREDYGPVSKILAKIEYLFQALASAFRGQGFVSAGRIMEQIASGKVGGRGPEGPGGGRRGRGDAEMRETLNEWNVQVFDALTGKIPENATLTLGPLPEIMRTLGGAGNRMIMAASKLRKIRAQHPEVTVDALSKLPQLLADPVFVLDNSSDQRTGDRLFVTDMVLDGDTVLVASIKRHGRDSEGGKATIVVTAYGKDQFTSMMRAADERGDILYVRGEREGSGYKHTGANSLNAPLGGTMLTLRARSKILTPRSIFKRGKPHASSDMEMRTPDGFVRDKFKGLVGFRNWKNPSEWVSSFLTDRIVSENASVLALVPGRPLFAEMGKKLLSAQSYLRTKEDMDALRNDWHVKAADVADEWTRKQAKNPQANADLMDLMHRSTMTGIDPSKADDWGKNDNLLRSAKIEVSRLGDKAPDWAKGKLASEANRKRTYATVKQMYDALPAEYQAFYSTVKNTYEKLANDWDAALEDNLKNAARISLKNADRAYRQTMRKIKDDGLAGAEKAEAEAEAMEALKLAKSRSNAMAEGRIKSLRKIFEGQRLKGPYFPLARFGKYFVTTRNSKGEVVSFARMETEGQQKAHVADMRAKHPSGKVTFGIIDAKTSMRDQVDPKFVADVESIVGDSGADGAVLDAIWQRYLETLPDDSIRMSKIHRKGREGFSRDALRAFSHHMFHGAHQLARLKYGMTLQENVDDAREEARRSDNPNRMGGLVDEMQRRMEWTLNPQNSSWVAAASSLSFVWYLGVSPAAALVNISQTTIVGPAMMKARFQKVSTAKILGELAKASKEFMQGKGAMWSETWSVENAPSLTASEKAAMQEGYRRGTIDKTQAYDLASVAETGVEYNPYREKWMRRFGFAFHHAERFNREVTYLANYRLARADGLNHMDAIDAASDLTWKIHFSYQNSDRARVMQKDWPKFFLQFRQFSVNMIYRMFRDAHQALNGASKAERKEARTQLVGMTLSMMAHAGIKGVWGYGLLMGLLALFFPGDKDDLEDWMQDALLMEGDGMGVASWNFAMGAALNGIPGQVSGASLVERIGMPNLWFREPNRELEGTDMLQHYVNETLGPTVGILFSMARGAQYAADGELVRGFEAMTPKFVRDVVKAGRYATEGVTTFNGDDIVEQLSPWEVIMQANGFTPARVAERYDMNNRLKNREKRILDERKDLHREASDAIGAGDPLPESLLAKIQDFNERFPEFPITGETIRQSYLSRKRASDRNEFGVSLNPKLNPRLRDGLPQPIHN